MHCSYVILTSFLHYSRIIPTLFVYYSRLHIHSHDEGEVFVRRVGAANLPAEGVKYVDWESM